MTSFDFTPYLTGGGLRPDAVDGMQPNLQQGLAALFAAAPPDIRSGLTIRSGYRSPTTQSDILRSSLAKRYGPDAAARWDNYVNQAGGDVVAAGANARPWLRSIGETAWVAPPGSSNHQKGNAADLGFGSDAALKWAHDNAGQYGLAFPLSNENWHVEAAGSRGGAPVVGAAPMATAALPGNPLAGPVMGIPMAGSPVPGIPGSADPQDAGALFSQLMQMGNDSQSERQRAADADAKARRLALFSGVFA